jgi:phenylacetaldehyde dehydrogenase
VNRPLCLPSSGCLIHGQCCVAGSRLFVQRDRFDEVVDGVAEIAKSIRLGPGMEEGTQMGPLVSDEQ